MPLKRDEASSSLCCTNLQTHKYNCIFESIQSCETQFHCSLQYQLETTRTAQDLSGVLCIMSEVATAWSTCMGRLGAMISELQSGYRRRQLMVTVARARLPAARTSQ